LATGTFAAYRYSNFADRALVVISRRWWDRVREDAVFKQLDIESGATSQVRNDDMRFTLPWTDAKNSIAWEKALDRISRRSSSANVAIADAFLLRFKVLVV
jgi:hypothetical protein